jgi:hypothetical protein
MKSFSMSLPIRAKFFFVDGPGGTSKTLLYKALLARVQSKGLIAIATATSGIAASILPRGRTARLKFQLKLGTTTCVALQSKVALQSCFVGHI